MKRLFVVLLTLIAVLSVRAEAWEYAGLSVTFADGAASYEWGAGATVVEAKSPAEFAQKLVAAGVLPVAPSDARIGVLLNELGARGWEVVQKTYDRAGNGLATRYFLKRRTG